MLSVKGGVWSVEHAMRHVWSAARATQNDDRDLQNCCACHENCNSSCENDAKVLRLPHKNDLRHVVKQVGMSQSAAPATQKAAWKPLKRRGFAASPIDTARRDTWEHRARFPHFVASKSTFSYEFS